jgi:hypothetical protein
MKGDQSFSWKLKIVYGQNRNRVLWIVIVLLSLYQIKAGIIPGWQMQSDFQTITRHPAYLLSEMIFQNSTTTIGFTSK